MFEEMLIWPESWTTFQGKKNVGGVSDNEGYGSYFSQNILEVHMSTLVKNAKLIIFFNEDHAFPHFPYFAQCKEGLVPGSSYDRRGLFWPLVMIHQAMGAAQGQACSRAPLFGARACSLAPLLGAWLVRGRRCPGRATRKEQQQPDEQQRGSNSNKERAAGAADAAAAGRPAAGGGRNSSS